MKKNNYNTYRMNIDSKHRNKLIIAITANMIFSIISALIMLFYAKTLGNMYGILEYEFFRFIGAGLLVFAVLLFLVRRNPQKRYVLNVVLADLGWVMGSILIILFDPFTFYETGVWITAILATIVFLLALWQYAALKKLSRSISTKES
jgi:drug/metabolite transporter (DMT)-like permease